MSDQDKPGSSQVEHPSFNDSLKPRKRGCVGHCVRFWWAYLLLVIAVVVLVVCLVLFVGVPHIAQSKLDDATLTIQGIAVTNTQTTNLTMAINSTITSSGGVSATIDGFTGDMYLEDLEPHTPFASINFPSTSASVTEQTVNVSQFLNITNMAALTTFNTWLATNDSLRVTVVGNTNVHVSGIAHAYPVTFSKTVTMPGLRQFEGVNVTQSSISLTADAEGNNLHGYVTIPDYSLFTLEIGNATFKAFLLGEEVGTAYVNDIYLVPGGVNNFSLAGNISQTPVLTALGQSPYCTNGGVLPLTLQGSKVINNGQPLSYFADALAAGNETVTLPVGADLKAVNVTVACGGAISLGG